MVEGRTEGVGCDGGREGRIHGRRNRVTEGEGWREGGRERWRERVME